MIRLAGLVVTPAIGNAPVGSTNETSTTPMQTTSKKPGALKQQRSITTEKKGGQRARLAMTLRKLKEELGLTDQQLKVISALENKMLDPVGHEDNDIDNDGDADSSDKYLKNRRDTIKTAMSKEHISEMLDDDESEEPSNDGDYEGNMARAQLMSIKKSADRLFNMIGDNEGLEAWVQSKLTRAADEITSVYQYLDYEKNKNATAGDGMGTPSDKETGTM